MRVMLDHFCRMVSQGVVEVYNEFSLQHEFGLFLRHAQRDSKVQFERNVSFFFNVTDHFLKKEIDLSVFSPDRQELHYAIEFKFPRNGQYPEQMFSFCKDIAFLEQLKQAGFRNVFFIAFADDHLFYEGNADGIYRFFRGNVPLTGMIPKPTGTQNESVMIGGQYQLQWKPVAGTLKALLVEI